MPLDAVDEGSQNSIAEIMPVLSVNEGELPAISRSARLSSRRPAPVQLPIAEACDVETKVHSASPDPHPSLPLVPSKISQPRGTRSPFSSRSPDTSRPCSRRSDREGMSVSKSSSRSPPRFDRDDRSVSKSSSRSPRSPTTLAEEIHTIKHRRGAEPLIPLNPLRSFKRIEDAQSQYLRRVSRDSGNSQCQTSRKASKDSASPRPMSSLRASTTADAASLHVSVPDSSQFNKELEEHISMMAASAAEESARTLGYLARKEHRASSLRSSQGQTGDGLQAKRFDAHSERQRAGDDYRQQILDSVENTSEQDEDETNHETTIEKSLAQIRRNSKRASTASVAFCVSKLEAKLSRIRRRMSDEMQGPRAEDGPVELE